MKKAKTGSVNKRLVLLVLFVFILAGSLGINAWQLDKINQKNNQIGDLSNKLDIAWESSGDARYNESVSAQSAADREEDLKKMYNSLADNYNSLVDEYRRYNDDPNVYIFKVGPIGN